MASVAGARPAAVVGTVVEVVGSRRQLGVDRGLEAPVERLAARAPPDLDVLHAVAIVYRDVRPGRQAAAARDRAEVLGRPGELQVRQPDLLDTAAGTLATGRRVGVAIQPGDVLAQGLAALAVLDVAQALLVADVLAHAARGGVTPPRLLGGRGGTG